MGASVFGSAPAFGPAPAGEIGSALAGAGPRLVAVAGPYAGQVFTLPASGGTIGREPSREVALTADATVSRRHAEIVPEAGALVLRDAGSSNGTFVNGQRIQQHSLQPGDEIRVGATLFRFEA
jgi:pSer/pThr/pTyr-binding forkhead associated (FHA) protein